MKDRGKSVWVIDDDVAVLALLESIFDRAGFEVYTSDSVAGAMEELHLAHDPALVIMDINLRGGTGLDVLRELRRSSLVPVIVMSNVRRHELSERAFELGADWFVEKPFDPQLLLARAHRLVS